LLPTIKRLGAGDGSLGGPKETIEAVYGALSKGGIVFIPVNGGGAGARLRKG
jgi:hypothetical protein